MAVPVGSQAWRAVMARREPPLAVQSRSEAGRDAVQRPPRKAGHTDSRASTEVAPGRVRRSLAPILDECRRAVSWPSRCCPLCCSRCSPVSPQTLEDSTGSALGHAAP